MTELEELTRRKEQLLLERTIAKLERRQRFESRANAWSWWWVAPVFAVGLFFLFLGLSGEGNQGETNVAYVLGLAGVAPLGFKLFLKR